ncbi:hypothetical protein RD792_001592 [Penstemon davidsonii]|uniref:Nucleotide-diphospho-sugar transferase domain-containing protein n=1 Tax=Penstemon davidsonii TaxID=160366 RepID=A0ABR0DNS9_9LAMI|nr:hypothetical protein RD792_001592 [Penstemon davidsonii]
MASKSSQIKPDDFDGGGPRLNPNDEKKHHHRYFFHSLVVLLFTIFTVACLVRIQGVDFSGETQYMTPDYLEMMWKRTDFLRQVVETGYNFIFTDADIMWFRNPFPHFHLDTNFQIACDKFNGNPWDMKNAPNGGFIYVKSSNQTIEFYKFWIKSREVDPRKNEQDVLNRIKFDPFVRKNIGVEIKFLDTVCFGGFCQPSKDLNLVCTMHSNCCIGLDNKIHDLKIMLEDWRKYMSLSESERRSQPTTWSVPQYCG